MFKRSVTVLVSLVLMALLGACASAETNATPVATAVAVQGTATTIPPTPVPPTATPRPTLGPGLVLAHDGVLVHWDPVKDVITQLPLVAEGSTARESSPAATMGTISNVVVDNTGRKVAFVRTVGTAVMLNVLDMQTMRVTELTKVTEQEVFELAFAPDSSALAYAAGIPSGKAPHPGNLYVVKLDDAHAPQVVAEILTNSDLDLPAYWRGMAWMPDSQGLVWSDGAAVWHVASAGGAPEQLLTNGFGPTRGEGGVYNPVAVSPDGGFVVMRVGAYEGSNFSVYDFSSGRLEAVPNSGEYVAINARIAWSGPYTLMVAYSGSFMGETNAPKIERWHATPGDGATILSLEQSAVLPGPTNLQPFAASVLHDGRFAFLMTGNFDMDQNPLGIYAFVADVQSLAATPIGQLPTEPNGDAIRWYMGSATFAQDASGALVRNGDGGIAWWLRANGAAVNMREHLQSGPICCAVWVNDVRVTGGHP